VAAAADCSGCFGTQPRQLLGYVLLRSCTVRHIASRRSRANDRCQRTPVAQYSSTQSEYNSREVEAELTLHMLEPSGGGGGWFEAEAMASRCARPQYAESVPFASFQTVLVHLGYAQGVLGSQLVSGPIIRWRDVVGDDGGRDLSSTFPSTPLPSYSRATYIYDS
jgi:hypothetical protein